MSSDETDLFELIGHSLGSMSMESMWLVGRDIINHLYDSCRSLSMRPVMLKSWDAIINNLAILIF